MPTKPTWKELLKRSAPVQLPAAHDTLTAKMIEQAGFGAYQIGGFAVVGARHGLPDIDLMRLAEQTAAARDIMSGSTLPALLDCDDGYGDVKNVVHTVQVYEQMGVSAIFLEDQVAPKRCGHMAGKSVVPAEAMEAKLRAAVFARKSPDFFIVARTDARESLGLDEAIRRGERYLKAGADAIYVEAPKSREDLKTIGKAFRGVPQVTNMFEGDEETPWLTPAELYEMGFSMVLYPTTLLFRIVRALQRALADLRAGKRTEREQGVNMEEFEEIVGLAQWKEIEKRFS